MWRPPNDPQIYGQMDLDATPIVAFLAKARARGHKLTPTHVVGRAVAHVLDKVPDLNVRIVGANAYPRPSVDIFFITAVGGGSDLSGVKVVRASRKSVYEIATELDRRARKLKHGEDAGFARSKHLMDNLPGPLLRVALRAATWLATTHAIPVPLLGLEACPFGSAMVTSVGMFGLPAGFAPIAWMYEVPLLIMVGEITDKPVAVNGRVEVRPILPIGATLDHRFVDGWHVSHVMTAFREYLAAPERFEPDLARQEDADADRPSVPPSQRVS
jgi:pyruvate dehydrogenase E2 component (dihydrolipoamide acetyltransferase)